MLGGEKMIENVIVGMVLHDSLTGYDIKKEVELSIGNFVKASHGSLYPALKKLAAKSFLTMKEAPQNGRMKKYYQATELGKEAFLDWLVSPLDPNALTTSLLAKVYFFNELSPEVRIEQFQAYEIHIQQILQDLEKLEGQYFSENENEANYYGMSTLYYGLQNAQGVLRWLKHIKKQKPLSEFINRD